MKAGFAYLVNHASFTLTIGPRNRRCRREERSIQIFPTLLYSPNQSRKSHPCYGIYLNTWILTSDGDEWSSSVNPTTTSTLVSTIRRADLEHECRYHANARYYDTAQCSPRLISHHYLTDLSPSLVMLSPQYSPLEHLVRAPHLFASMKTTATHQSNVQYLSTLVPLL